VKWSSLEDSLIESQVRLEEFGRSEDIIPWGYVGGIKVNVECPQSARRALTRWRRSAFDITDNLIETAIVKVPSLCRVGTRTICYSSACLVLVRISFHVEEVDLACRDV
jgi:hypothetical protein